MGKLVGFERMAKRFLFGLNPWIPLFAFVAAFQAMRGANFDAIYFSVVAIVLIVDWKKLFPFEFPGKPNLKFHQLTIIPGLIIFALLALDRKSPIEVALMLSLLLVAVALVWYKDSGPQPDNTKALRLSKWLWITLAVMISLWELFAYILSDVASDKYAYPTISILMVPFMESEAGPLVFLLIWFAIGVSLLKLRRAK